MRGTKESCQCIICKSFCRNRVGWFKPNEIEKVAKFLNISLKELFNTKLSVDWWCGDPDTFVIAPMIKDMLGGCEFPGNPTGECIFFNNDLCDIHSVKPYECKEAFHDSVKSDIHEKVAKSWLRHQKQIRDLLGRAPIAKSFSMFGIFSFLNYFQ